MKFLVQIKFIIQLVVFLLFTSCSLQTTKNWVNTETNQEFVENTYFSDTNIDYVYKAKINVYNQKFGGILIIKKTGEQEHRVVFTTEFGTKLFDFKYVGETFTKEFIIEELDKKYIVNTLQKDFKLLISEKAIIQEKYEVDGDEVYKTNTDKRTNFYFINKKTHTLDKIVNTTKSKEKVEILFSEIDDEIANNISILHQNINLQIELEKFTKE